MGRFDFVPGVQEEGSPVYRQAHSKEIPNAMGVAHLYRWVYRQACLSHILSQYLSKSTNIATNIETAMLSTVGNALLSSFFCPPDLVKCGKLILRDLLPVWGGLWATTQMLYQAPVGSS